VKRCPTCDTSFEDEDVFCELDGGRLVAESVSPQAVSSPDPGEVATQARRDAPTMAPTMLCPSCHKPNSDDGDGYCSGCGMRLELRLSASILPTGATLGGCTVTGSRAIDDVNATSKAGAEVVIAVGDLGILTDEADAARALAGNPAAPKLLDVGEDPRRGPFLVLAAPPPDATLLAEAAPQLGIDAAFRLAREVLALTLSLEKGGLRWTPRDSDFYLRDTRLLLSRVRAARLDGGRADACCPVATFGRSLLPVPGLAGSPALFRLLAGPRLDAPHELRDVDTIRAALDAAEEELARAPHEGPNLAALCDGGLKRDHNEDAVAVAKGETKGEPWTVLVVCDGVSCSTHAEQASAVAAKTACDALAHFARSGDIAHEAATGAMHAAIKAAHLAVCSAQIDHGNKEPPGTTIVAGLVYRRRLTVGWVGDSRAYWVAKNGSELLTRDHSWAQESVARGDMSEEDAMQQPLAHALTRCLGPLEGGDTDEQFATVQADVRSRDLPGPGHVVLCTDGLWNYFPDARTIAELLAAAGQEADCDVIARRLVSSALYRGGGDNVSVAVYRHPETR
jgi:PPM family protein phosphatase